MRDIQRMINTPKPLPPRLHCPHLHLRHPSLSRDSQFLLIRGGLAGLTSNLDSAR